MASAPRLKHLIPHQLQIFTGPFFPQAKFEQLQSQLQSQTAALENVILDRYTPNLLPYMQQADLSISMSGYNTTMNVLTTGVRAMMLAFTGNDDQEQQMRAQKLDALGLVTALQPQDLAIDRFTDHILRSLERPRQTITIDFDGVAKTAAYTKELITLQQAA